jgi:NAD-dependent deacetylase
MVPELENAAVQVSTADIFIVIGTSLAVYPAASLTEYAPEGAEKYFIDPEAPEVYHGFTIIREKAGTGTPLLTEKLISKYSL